MGRCAYKHKVRPLRKLRVSAKEDGELITVEELAMLVQRSALQPPDHVAYGADMLQTRQASDDLGKYGDWSLPTGELKPGEMTERALRMMCDLRNEPHPNLFHPPPLLGSNGYDEWAYNWNKASTILQPGELLFEKKMSLIKLLSQMAASRLTLGKDRDDDDEGAVGYDRRFYKSSLLVERPRFGRRIEQPCGKVSFKCKAVGFFPGILLEAKPPMKREQLRKMRKWIAVSGLNSKLRLGWRRQCDRPRPASATPRRLLLAALRLERRKLKLNSSCSLPSIKEENEDCHSSSTNESLGDAWLSSDLELSSDSSGELHF